MTSGEPQPELDIRRGTMIGRFVVVAELGAGGMGVVFAAHDRQLDRQVALKIMRSSAESEDDRMRMLREGQAMARVTHANVITVYEVGIERGMVFLAQELLDGGTLGQWLQKRHSQRAIIDKFVAAGRGLAAAHAAGLVHRDFKPDNVLLGKDGRVRVADFGLARALSATEAVAVTVGAGLSRAATDLGRSPMSPLTRTGAVMGTPMFMAPEQHEGLPADERSDQFSFSVALYQALYGDWPFPGKSAIALADAVIAGRLQPPPKSAAVPAHLRRILLRGLSKKPEDRYPSMNALLADLAAEPGRPMRRAMVGLTFAALVGGAAVGGYVLYQRSQSEPPVAPAPPPLPADLAALTTNRGVEWLTSAIERGQLDDAFEKYRMASELLLRANDKLQGSIAQSAGAFTLALRGRLPDAETALRDAETNQGADAIAIAYADMAGAAIASARGDLGVALDRSRKCALAFTETIPVLATICFQIHGETAADAGEFAVARKDFTDALALAKKNENVPRTTALELALVQLDLDEDKDEQAAAQALAVQTAAAERGAAGLEVYASIVHSRALLAQASSQKALEALDRVKPATLQLFRTRVTHTFAQGQAHALLGDAVTGLERIEAARAEAEKEGFAGLVLEARLARLVVQIAVGSDTVAAEQKALIADAKAKSYARIARLAEQATQR